MVKVYGILYVIDEALQVIKPVALAWASKMSVYLICCGRMSEGVVDVYVDF